MTARTHTSATARARLARVALATLSTAVALALAEMLTRSLSIDQRLLTASLFFQGAALEEYARLLIAALRARGLVEPT